MKNFKILNLLINLISIKIKKLINYTFWFCQTSFNKLEENL